MATTQCLSKTCIELLEIIHHQEQVIEKQNETITKLVNETTEQENMINELMREQIDLPY